MKKVTIYIAGPMTGIPNFNYPAFHEAESVLKRLFPDAVIENPARNFGGRQDLPYETYLEAAFKQVRRSDTIFLLPGWKESKGVARELEIAKDLKLNIFSTILALTLNMV